MATGMKRCCFQLHADELGHPKALKGIIIVYIMEMARFYPVGPYILMIMYPRAPQRQILI